MSLCCAFPPWSLDQWIKSLDGLHVAAPPFLAEAIELWDTKMARSTARLGNISKNMGLSCDGTDLNSWILISITFPFRSAWDASNFSSPWGLSLLTWERKAGFSPGARWRQRWWESWETSAQMPGGCGGQSEFVSDQWAGAEMLIFCRLWNLVKGGSHHTVEIG